MYKICQTEQSNRRQRELEQGLLQLMLRRNYEDISVSDLCDHLQIPRKSFYRYFFQQGWGSVCPHRSYPGRFFPDASSQGKGEGHSPGRSGTVLCILVRKSSAIGCAASRISQRHLSGTGKQFCPAGRASAETVQAFLSGSARSCHVLFGLRSDVHDPQLAQAGFFGVSVGDDPPGDKSVNRSPDTFLKEPGFCVTCAKTGFYFLYTSVTIGPLCTLRLSCLWGYNNIDILW